MLINAHAVAIVLSLGVHIANAQPISAQNLIVEERPANLTGIAAPGNVGDAKFPQIELDHSVSFRLKAPAATRVTLEGGEGLVKAPLEMTRGDDGTWSVTTSAAAPGFHYYWFMVDGLRVNDPASYSYFGWGRETSGVEVPSPDEDFYLRKAGVAQGAVRAYWYESNVTGKWRRAHVYTPPGYEADRDMRYPVLYILHGAGENERSWIEQGRLQVILDNLLATKSAQPMIIVADSGYAAFGSTSIRDQQSPTSAFEDVLLKELIPTIDATFRTTADAQHRALAGLSMGGGQTLRVGLKHPETFASLAAMSAPPRGEFDPATAFEGVFADAATFNDRVKLLWLGAGIDEPKFHESTKAMADALTNNGINYHFFSSPNTGHEWQTWRRSLRDVAAMLFRE